MISTMKTEATSRLPDAVGASAVLAVAPVVFEPDVSAPMFGADTTGVPLVLPCTEALLALTMTGAETTRLPEERTPAEPKSILPRGANRSRLDAAAAVDACRVPMPAPLTKPPRSTDW